MENLTNSPSKLSTQHKVLIAVLVGVVFVGIWLYVKNGVPFGRDYKMETIQGMVEAIDRDENRLILTEALLNGEGMDGQFEQTSYVVSWDDKTEFFAYDDERRYADDIKTPLQEEGLQINRNILVKIRNMDGNRITGDVIFLLPGEALITPDE